MCGIAGQLGLGSERAEPARLERMIAEVRHRGPDASGLWVDGPVGLAHARLSILDLEGGGQPMSDEAGRVHLVYNGEIFNYLELRRELEAKGHRFRTRSDTEVLLRLYLEKGDACVEDLNGQWAFALWDARRRRLLLSRDRVGILPLHYAWAGRTLLFASEAKSLLAHPALSRELDLEALRQVFTFWFPLSPRTAFAHVHELPPGHNLVVEGGRATVRRYWSVDFAPEPTGRSEAEDADALLELLTDATRIRLRADVPVGAYLSGGLDSSVVTALVRRVHPLRPRTFSVAFSDPEYDERSYQDAVIRHLDTDHARVECRHDEIASVFPEVVRHAEKPLARTAAAPLFLLSRLVREQGYKVVLTGEGSDEFLGGYDIFKEVKVRAFWAAQPASRLRPLLLRRLYPYLPRMQAQSPAYLMAFFHVRPDELSSPFFSHLPRWQHGERLAALFSPEVRAAWEEASPLTELEASLPADYARWSPFLRAQWLEAAHLLPGYLLSSQGDRMIMAHSVEGRFPFLDHRVIELASRLPLTRKMRVLDEKRLLKVAARRLLPEAVVRRPKQPYRAPDAAAFFGPDGPRPWVAETLSPDRLRAAGIFEPAAVEHLVRRLAAGRRTGARDDLAFVGVLSTQILHDQYVDRAWRNP